MKNSLVLSYRQAYGDFIFAKEEFLNAISMFLRFLLQATEEKLIPVGVDPCGAR
ncbi:MAG: hypothetical protein ACI8WT_000846 [Clostridium sp.]|jgi:hypothetical protein